MSRWRKAESQEWIIGVGEEMIIFQESLGKLFDPESKDWYWGWTARPASPRNPASKWQEEGWESSATFWFVVTLDRKSIRESPEQIVSDKIVIKFTPEI